MTGDRGFEAIHEISTPAASEEVPEIRSCLLRVMQRQDVGLRSIACCADVIGAHARFNLRVATLERPSASHERIHDLVDDYDQLVEACLRSVAKFDANGDADALNQSWAELANRLNAAAAARTANR